MARFRKVLECRAVDVIPLVECFNFCPSTARGVAHVECGPASVGVCMCVASPASHSTMREGLNLPVWSWQDYSMLLYPAQVMREGLHTQSVALQGWEYTARRCARHGTFRRALQASSTEDLRSVRGQPAGRSLPVAACGPAASDGWPETPLIKGKKRGHVKV